MSKQLETEADELARLITLVSNDKQLHRILRDAVPQMRKVMYDLVKPHLRFTPKPYYLFKFSR